MKSPEEAGRQYLGRLLNDTKVRAAVEAVSPNDNLKTTQPIPEPQSTTPIAQSSSTGQDVGEGKEKLKRLEAMKTLGLISQEEFEKEKAKLEGTK